MKKLLSIVIVVIMLLSLGCVALAEETDYFAGQDEIQIVSIGGSITQGGSPTWSQVMVDKYFKVRYPNKNIKLQNSSAGGTGSDYAVYRTYRDVVQYNPDVVLIEFAINDNGKPADQVKNQIENMVRQINSMEKKPYIIFVYTTNQERSNENTIQMHEEVARAYGINGIYINKLKLCTSL